MNPPGTNLDVDGYNYFLESQLNSLFVTVPLHTVLKPSMQNILQKHLSLQNTHLSALENWEKAEKYPYVLGSFKWTAMDYIGEAGIGRPLQVPASRKLPNG